MSHIQERVYFFAWECRSEVAHISFINTDDWNMALIIKDRVLVCAWVCMSEMALLKEQVFFVREDVWVKGPYKRKILCILACIREMSHINERVYVCPWVCRSEMALIQERVFLCGWECISKMALIKERVFVCA